MYTVVIIEDDPMITRLNRRYVEQDSRFAVVQTFSAAHPALFWLQRNPIDLIILDVYMPQMSGTELLMQHGSTTYLEVLTAQQSLLSAQLSQIADRFDEIQGTVNLYQALGGGRDITEEK